MERNYFMTIIDGTLLLHFTVYKAESGGRILQCGTKESCIRLKVKKHVLRNHNKITDGTLLLCFIAYEAESGRRIL